MCTPLKPSIEDYMKGVFDHNKQVRKWTLRSLKTRK